MTPVVVMTTVGNAADAQSIAASLVERRYAACVNIIDGVRSIYRWEGRVTDEPELILLIKTVQERLRDVREHLISIHPYQVPEFIVLQIDDISGKYREWLEQETAKK